MTVTLPEPQAWLDDVKTRCVEVEVSKDGYEFETFVTLLDATANVHADTRDGTTAHIVSRDSYMQKNKYGEMEPIQGAFRKYRVTVRP
jgi:hypothetical protein